MWDLVGNPDRFSHNEAHMVFRVHNRLQDRCKKLEAANKNKLKHMVSIAGISCITEDQ